MSWKFALVLSVFGPALAAQPALEGTVTDPIRHTGMAGVSVRLTSPNHPEHETTTDESGRFTFNNLPAEAYTVILQKEVTSLPMVRMNSTDGYPWFVQGRNE